VTPARRWLIAAAVLILAGLLAFPLREPIYRTIVIPAAFIVWNLDLLYRSFSQGAWWWGTILLVFVMLVFSLVPHARFHRREAVKPRSPQGQVESLAVWLRKAERGIYFKWLVANRLGKLAYQVLLQRESGRPRSVFAPLVGPDWEPSRELQAYLETGLHGSFADYPASGRLSPHQPTPLDLNVSEAVDFLESQVQNGK
jgi:hypothetical protein